MSGQAHAEAAAAHRGVVGRGIDPLVVTEIAAHFGAWAGGRGLVAVGRDSRVSGEMLLAATTAGLVGSGCTVVDLGIVGEDAIFVHTGGTPLTFAYGGELLAES